MKVWIVFLDPYAPIVESVFNTKDKAEDFKLQRINDHKRNTGKWPVKGMYWVKEFEVL